MSALRMAMEDYRRRAASARLEAEHLDHIADDYQRRLAEEPVDEYEPADPCPNHTDP